MGRPVTADQRAYLLVIAIPLFAVWVIAVVDVVRQPRMSTRAKLIWVVLFSLIWPLLIVYWMTRPVQGRLERAGSREYPHAQLVDAALDHEDGALDDEQMAAVVRGLRPG
jgi:hypothetical protein